MTTKVSSNSPTMLKSKSQSENINNLWTDFIQETGFHGVNKLTLGRHYKLRCAWWTLAILCMTTYMTYNITKELMNFYSYPTVTTIRVEQVEELVFPAVTICNQSPFSMTKVRAVDPELESYFKRANLVGYFMNPLDMEKEYLSSTFRDCKTLDWWKGLYIELDDLFYGCFMKGKTYFPCTKIMRPVMTDYGLCATLNFNASNVETIRLSGADNNLIMFAAINQDDYVPNAQLSAGLKVFLHEPTVHPDAATSEFLAAPGTTTYAAVKTTTFKYLPSPYKAFGNRTCVDTTSPNFNNTLEFFATYTYEHCIQECITRTICQECGCCEAEDHESLGPKCSIYNLTVCHRPAIVNISQDAESMKSCGCETPCTFQTYEAKLSTAKYPSKAIIDLVVNESSEENYSHLRDNYLELRIYYEKLMVQSIEQVAQFNTETVIGNLGGQMGICLGASILTLTELGEFILFVCLTMFRRLTHPQKQVTTGTG